MMTRAEHLEWAKRRALEYLDDGDLTNALASMLSDLGKHPELENHSGKMLGMMSVMAGTMRTPEEYREWIEGFN